MRRDLITACSDINQHGNRSRCSSDDKTAPDIALKRRTIEQFLTTID